ncbi:hypothetical protein CCHR01_09461 [Colletotrichum chrysophilum]|uniref:Uncharacterized protein n=1 Tax=Colletotrichum chrysophilum TaxID=1836956 RepID=A0AAD9EHS0_9PEZI|nr:hypothetical protein CCHR01_09461 [Colletotrichum chrysophilum]
MYGQAQVNPALAVVSMLVDTSRPPKVGCRTNRRYICINERLPKKKNGGLSHVRGRRQATSTLLLCPTTEPVGMMYSTSTAQARQHTTDTWRSLNQESQTKGTDPTTCGLYCTGLCCECDDRAEVQHQSAGSDPIHGWGPLPWSWSTWDPASPGAGLPPAIPPAQPCKTNSTCLAALPPPTERAAVLQGGAVPCRGVVPC